MKSRSLAAFIAISALVVLTIPASTAQDASTQTDESATTTPAVPLINQPLIPDAIKPGSAGFTLTVNGTGFVLGSVVEWNHSARPTTFVSRSKLTATIFSSDIAKPGTASVTVVNPGPGGTSNVIFFDVAPPISPVVLNRTAFGTGSGSQPDSVGVGDFNGDSKLDLAVADINSNTVTILLGNGDGTFQAEVGYATESGPDSVIVGDFNGDGKLDLAVRNYLSNSVSILLGNGDGTFQTALNFATGNVPNREVAGDFNEDGKLDLAVTNDHDNTVSVLLGNGDGTFQAHRDYPAGPSPVGVATGDFNRDGKLDLAVANFKGTNTVSILLGNGDGTFQPPAAFATGPAPVYVAVGDFNGDGKLDLAVANWSGNTVSILLGNGNGTFRPHVDYAVGAGPFMVATADIDADGKLDLAIANRSDGTVSILRGNGDGTFGVANNFVAGSGPQPTYVALADFNRDGRPDLAVATLGDAVSVMLETTTVIILPSILNFATQVVGTKSPVQTVILTNTGKLTLTISRIAITGTDPNDFSHMNNCPALLPPRAHCTISVTFTPSQLGPETASLTFTDSAPASPQSVPLSGIGVTSGPNATLLPASLTYSTRLVGTTSPAQSVTLRNYGAVALTITSIGFTGADPGDFHQTSTCESSVAPGASCTINVTFTPAQLGPRTAKLSITDNAPGSPQTVSVTGTGTVVKLHPGSLGFGIVPVGRTATQSTTLTNVGRTALRIAGIAIAGAGTDEFHQNNTCDTSVGAGKSCTITVTFTPKERGGDSADVSISDNGGGSPQQVSLSGTGCVYGYRHKCLPLISSPAVQSALAKSPTTAVPSVTGANRVGTRLLDLVDSSRTDPFAANGNREVLVRLWYPASADQGCKLADYTSPGVWNYFSELTRMPLPQVTSNSCLDAPVADGEHSVVVFTHGYTGTFTDYTFLFEDLASRGYVVSSIDHTYEATAVEFPDGRFIKSMVGSHLANTWRTDDQTLSSALSVRLDDLKFVIDELSRLNVSTGNAFAGKLDLTRLALAGHSLGGLSTWFGVQRDGRFKAAVLLDPYLPDIPLGSTETPVMLLTMGREQRNEGECQLWSHLLGPRFSVNLRGAEHVTPSDAVWLAKGAIETGPMGPEKTISAVRDYIAAFLDANLRGTPAGRLLSGPSSEYPDAAVTTQEESLCRKP